MNISDGIGNYRQPLCGLITGFMRAIAGALRLIRDVINADRHLFNGGGHLAGRGLLYACRVGNAAGSI